MQAAGGKRNVAGDHDIAAADVCRDPVVGGVGAGVDHHPADQRIGDAGESGIADEMDGEAMTAGDPQHLRLYRTGIAVDKDLDQARCRFCRNCAVVPHTGAPAQAQQGAALAQWEDTGLMSSR